MKRCTIEVVLTLDLERYEYHGAQANVTDILKRMFRADVDTGAVTYTFKVLHTDTAEKIRGYCLFCADYSVFVPLHGEERWVCCECGHTVLEKGKEHV